MKKKVFAITAATVFALSAIVACNKKQTATTLNSTMDAQAQCQQADFTTFNFGNAHNADVKTLTQGLDYSNPATLQQQIIDKFDNASIDVSQLGMTRADYNEKIGALINTLSAEKFDIRNSTDPAVLNSNYYPYVLRIIKEVETMTSVARLNNNVEAIVTDATNNLSCLDRDIVIATAKTAEGSAQLWSPTNLGGQGFQISGHQWLSTDSWKGAVIGDMSGSCQYFSALGFAAAVGWGVPGANVAILGGWAFATALGSGCGALGF